MRRRVRHKTPEKQEIYDMISHLPLTDAQPVPGRCPAAPDQLLPVAVIARAVVRMCEQCLLKRIVSEKKNSLYYIRQNFINNKSPS